jgi:hypothetical protein
LHSLLAQEAQENEEESKADIDDKESSSDDDYGDSSQTE